MIPLISRKISTNRGVPIQNSPIHTIQGIRGGRIKNTEGFLRLLNFEF